MKSSRIDENIIANVEEKQANISDHFCFPSNPIQYHFTKLSADPRRRECWPSVTELQCLQQKYYYHVWMKWELEEKRQVVEFLVASIIILCRLWDWEAGKVASVSNCLTSSREQPMVLIYQPQHSFPPGLVGKSVNVIVSQSQGGMQNRE